ncbi:MAG: helix-turn-helix domain-containing protein [Acidimicrobiia bacterium]
MSDDPTSPPPPPEPIRTYRIDVEGGSWWELAWLPHAGTYEAVHFTVDRHEIEQILAWHGAGEGDVTSIDQLRSLVDVEIPDHIAEGLARDRAGHPLEAPGSRSALQSWIAQRPERGVPHLDYGTRWIDSAAPDRYHRLSWIPDTGELYVTDGTRMRVLAVVPERRQLERALLGWAVAGSEPEAPLTWVEQRVAERLQTPGPGDVSHPSVAETAESTRSVPAPADALRRLAAWEEELRTWEARLAAREAALAAAAPEPRHSLPAAPATDELRALLGEPGFSTSEVGEFARGLGLDVTLTEQLLSGRLAEVDVEQVASLCEALHCSPYDMWGPELACSILRSYGPERWPSHIEPLGERSLGTAADDFVRRRVEARAAELAEPLAAVGRSFAPPELDAHQPEAAKPRRLEATCFARTGVIAVDVDGGMSAVDDPAHAPEPGLEYHFTFRQLGPPATVDLTMTQSELREGPLPGFDVVPALATAAEQLREGSRSLRDAELVRFVDPSTSAEQWIGWDSDVAAWQTWDDPRRYYPGNPVDVLDTEVADALRLDPFPPSSVVEDLGCGCVPAESGPSLDL